MISQIREKLFSIQDIEYGNFQASLMPTVNIDTIIGVRTPLLRSLAKELKGQKGTDAFLSSLPHRYYEENNLHAFIISEIKDFDECIECVREFLPYINNWATCDSMRPTCFKKNKSSLIQYVDEWLCSEHIYTKRYGIGMLLSYYLDEQFSSAYLEKAANIISDEYYVNMMLAWYFATALAKQWDSTLPYITQMSLPLWVHNKTIQKALESYRITDEQKCFLRSFRR